MSTRNGSLRLGDVVDDRFQIVDEIQSTGTPGVMGRLWKATDLQTGALVVVKIPRGEAAEAPDFLVRFEREIRRLLTLRHPHVAPLLANGQVDGLPYYVMPFYSGSDLAGRRQRIGRGSKHRLPLDDFALWLPHVSGALDFIHTQNVSHRDVKPENILFDHHAVPYLTDFGIAKARVGENSLTPFDQLAGSPSYVPPEAITARLRPERREATSSPYFDQYSLATVVYQLVCGDLPYPGGTAYAVLLMKAKEDPAPLDRMADDVPAAFSKAVARAMSRTPTDRFPSCRAFSDAIAASFTDRVKRR